MDRFNARAPRSELKKRSVKGGLINITAQFFKLFLQLLSTAVLARLLTPQDYGLIAMITVISGFIMMFNDLGLSMATIQKENITHEQLSNMFWVNTGLGLAVSLTAALLSPLVSWFYKEPRLFMINLLFSSVFLLSGLSSQHKAIMQRQMRFLELSFIDILATCIGIALAITLALKGAHYYAIVAMQIAITGTTTLCLWFKSGWRPGLLRKNAGTRSMLHFGLNVTGFDIVNYLARNIDNLLLGKVYGPQVLGFYNKAYQVMMLPIQVIRTPLNQVALPALSTLQNNPDQFTRYYANLISIIAFATMPLTVLMVTCSRELIGILLGPQWLEASDIFMILSVTAFIQPIASTRGLVLMSLGKTSRYLQWGILNSIIVIISFIIGIRWGALGVATGYGLANYLVLFPSLLFCFKETPVQPSLFFRSIVRPSVASILAGALILTFKSAVPIDSLWARTFYCFGIGMAGYLGIWLLLPGGGKTLATYLSLLKK